MNIRYDLNKLKSTVDDLCILTGVCMAILDSKGNYLYSRGTDAEDMCHDIQMSADGLALCGRSDRKMIEECRNSGRPVTHICHAGLRDTVMPILKMDTVVGFVIIGRLRPTEDPANLPQLSSALSEKYARLPFFTEERLEAMIRLVARSFLDGAIEIEYDELIKRATDHIERNISGEISIDSLCRELFVSKNQLYKSFRELLSSTVGEYVTRRRIALAKLYLSESDEPIKNIADSVGIYNYAYFSRLFKAQTGLSPTEYRRILRSTSQKITSKPEALTKADQLNINEVG